MTIRSYTIATMPDASSVVLGTVINIPQSEFGSWATSYMPNWGIYLQSNLINWLPAEGYQVFAFGYGTEAVPLVADQITGTASTWTPFTLAAFPYIPAELMYVGLRIGVSMIGGKSSASSAGVILGVQFGTSAVTANNPNSWLAICGTQSNQTDRQGKINNHGIITSSNGFSADTKSTSTSLIANASNGINTTNNAANSSDNFKDFTGLSSAVGGKNYILPSFWCSNNTSGNLHNLYSFRFTLEI